MWSWISENKGWFAGIALSLLTAVGLGVRAMLIRMVWPIQLAAHSNVRAIWLPNLSYAANPHIVFLVSLKVHPRVNNTVNKFYLLIKHSGREYNVSSFSGYGEGIPIPIKTGTKLDKGQDIGPFQGRFEISEIDLPGAPFEGQKEVVEWLMNARIYAVITTSYRNRWRILAPLKLEGK